LGLMVWVYLFQNIILGFYWPAKVLTSAQDSSYTKKVQSIAVFLPHYILTHSLYAGYLYNFFGKELFANFKYILTMTGIFFLSETVSYFTEKSSNRARSLTLAKVHLFPYTRVVPMHFLLVVGITLELLNTTPNRIVMLFLLLKTLADVAMYTVERSSIFDNIITVMFEMQKKRSIFKDYLDVGEKQIIYRKEKQVICHLCKRVICRNETPWVINENVFCEECYNKIKKEKGKTA